MDISKSQPIAVSASSEFITLCQAQVSLLTQGLGAAWGAIYLTQTWGDSHNTTLVPLVIEPQNAAAQGYQKQLFSGLTQGTGGANQVSKMQLQSRLNNLNLEQIRVDDLKNEFWERKQLVIPLIYEKLMVGLLVTRREDREWQSQELLQIEKIAQTLAIACILDQRQTWYQQQLQQQQQLQELERNVLDDLFHQLRNPITALRTFSKLLLKRLLPDTKNQTVVEGMLRESDRLQSLLKQFEIDIEEIETNTAHLLWDNHPPLLPPRMTPTNLLPPSKTLSLETLPMKEIIEPLVVSACAIAQERDLEIIAKLADNLPPVEVNLQAIREVLTNIIDNAIKYTPAGGKIEIETGLETIINNTKYQGVAIKDTGYGIPLGDQKHIFERNYRGIQAKGDIEGTGLGLAIAQELITQMQGKIAVISPNHLVNNHNALLGTTFIIWLLAREHNGQLVSN